jgi:CzcA family heavy metal efflux pump
VIHLTKLALRRPVSVFIVVLGLIILGVMSLFTTPLELIPDIEMPMLVVYTLYPGAAPQEVESQVTSYIEDAAATLSGVKNVQSSSMENVSLVILEMEYGTNMDEAHSNLKNNLDMYGTQLPEDASAPTVIEINMDMMSTISLSASETGDVDLLYYVEEEILPEFEKLSGVASVSVYGGESDYIKVELIEQKLTQYNLSMSTISSILSTADFSLPAGSIGQGNLDLKMRGGVSYSTAEALREVPITLPTGDVIHLSDVARVYQTTGQTTSLSRYNGAQNVGISISKRQSASTIAVTRAVKKTVQQLNAAQLGVELDVVYDSSDMILDSITTVGQTLLYGALLAMVVLFVFLGDWRASLIVGSSIPVSLLVTLIAMSLMGFSFNILSIGGLVIGVGMMVDNSIVVTESCFRAKLQKPTLLEGVLEGTRVVASSVVASTLTTVVVFLPIAFLKGMSGQLFGQLCFTIVFSLVASLLSALTLVPLIFLRVSPTERENTPAHRIMARVEAAYRGFLPKTLRHKKTVVLIAAALLVLSFVAIPFIGVELLPATDEGTITISVNTRPGLKIELLDEKLKPIEEMIKAHPDVDRYSLSSGGSGMSMLSGSASASATITVYLKEGRKMSTAQVVDQWREQTDLMLDCDIGISSSSTTTMMAGGSDVEINLQATGLDELEEAAYQVEDLMKANPQILRVASSISSGNPQAEIVVDPIKAGAAGLAPIQVMNSVYTIMNGSEAATLHKGGRDYEVRVEYPENRFASVSDLAGLSIQNAAGYSIPLLDIATIEYSNSPQSIARKNGRYILTVSGQPASGAPTSLSGDISKQAEALSLPAGVEITKSAQAENQIEEFTALLYAIAVAVLLVFMVMAMQFESPRFSLVVMICIPFALIGSFGLLLLTGITLSLPSLMGFLMLSGIVVNNGILFIDTANRLRTEEGLSAQDALCASGVLRMRPIFMTTLTTILAMVPMTMGTGNAVLMKGMALVIIGGLIASTTLTLLLLPAFYLLFDKQTRAENKRIKKLKKPKSSAQAVTQ